MADTIQLELATYTDEGLNIDVTELYIPAFLGQVGILPNHKPYISLLKAGQMRYTDVFGKKTHYYIRGGIIEVREKNKVSVICDSMEKIELVNKKEIEDKLIELDKKIKSLVKIEPGMSEAAIREMPDQLAAALKEQEEFAVKWKIIQDIEAKK